MGFCMAKVESREKIKISSRIYKMKEERERERIGKIKSLNVISKMLLLASKIFAATASTAGFHAAKIFDILISPPTCLLLKDITSSR
jgi:hypothetical protein